MFATIANFSSDGHRRRPSKFSPLRNGLTQNQNVRIHSNWHSIVILLNHTIQWRSQTERISLLVIWNGAQIEVRQRFRDIARAVPRRDVGRVRQGRTQKVDSLFEEAAGCKLIAMLTCAVPRAQAPSCHTQLRHRGEASRCADLPRPTKLPRPEALRCVSKSFGRQ